MKASDLDAILNQALDDFEEQSMADQVSKQSGSKFSNSSYDEDVSLVQQQEKIKSRQEMEEMMSGLYDPDNGFTLQSTLKSLSTTKEGIENVDFLFEKLNDQFKTDYKSNLYPDSAHDDKGIQLGDREVAATMKMIGTAQKGMEGFEPAKLETLGETMMEDMISQFEALGEKEDYNEIVDGVMRQLLSKDLMYDPTRQICDKFPEWLAIHRKALNDIEYHNYGLQYQTFQKLLAVYDTEPDNFPRIMELMFDLQQYGQPPGEIIKDLAPGLKFDENGMPIMPNMGAGVLPEMPGGTGLPNLSEISENMAQGKCIIS